MGPAQHHIDIWCSGQSPLTAKLWKLLGLESKRISEQPSAICKPCLRIPLPGNVSHQCLHQMAMLMLFSCWFMPITLVLLARVASCTPETQLVHDKLQKEKRKKKMNCCLTIKKYKEVKFRLTPFGGQLKASVSFFLKLSIPKQTTVVPCGAICDLSQLCFSLPYSICMTSHKHSSSEFSTVRVNSRWCIAEWGQIVALSQGYSLFALPRTFCRIQSHVLSLLFSACDIDVFHLLVFPYSIQLSALYPSIFWKFEEKSWVGNLP